uniref:Ubiquitin-like protease family profile domain-containing protein n=1 Tax=Brassica oleracea var. oleracea TaxID=109376 RepID=A0A0D2ZS03_BRAOL
MAETPYWPTLFGGTNVVTVSSVIRMLRKKTVVDKEIRINIKERDEVALCQNTFALKGFVHAMQLVMVEAVPALTEVVQEVGSYSSESDSDREDGDLHEKRNKRLTLSPGHARDVDHKCEVPVICIIEDDSIHHVDNEYEDYHDEETDQKIENVLRLHSEKHDFNNSMFKGGLTMAEVERMGGKRKGKKKDTKTGKKSAFPETVSDSKEFTSMESRVGTLVESKIKSMIESVMVPMIEQKIFQMKGDIIQSIETMITNQHQDPIINSKSQPSSVQDHYNSDPTSNDTENVQPTENRYVQDEPSHIPEGDINISEMELFPVIEIPSFSLGLSQEDNNDDLVNGLAAEQVAVEKDNPFDLQECRRGKRQKTVTHGLVDVFQCSPAILNRPRESKMVVYGKADSWDYTQNVIHFGGCQVSNKDIIDIVERAKPYSSKVMDVLMKHLSLSYANQSLSEESKKSVFLDSKFVASLSRNYSKFSKIQAKETHVFTKGLVEVFEEMVDHCSDHYVFYVPFNLVKKHWVGLCVDASSWIITVFDCKTSLRSEASMSFELKPISEMFPYLMKQAGWRISNSQLVPMVVERAKTVPQNIISADSSLTSVLLMQTHALSGIEACRCIAPHILASEAQRVAVLLYEYHMKL